MNDSGSRRDAPGVLASGGTRTDRRNNIRLIIWSLVWAVVYTVAAQALKGNIGGLDVEAGVWRSRMIAAAPNLVAVGVLLAYLRFLRETDELVRLVQLQALALGFGVTFFFLLAWELFEIVGAPGLDPSDAVLVPIGAWVLGSLYFGWRYR